MFHMLLLLHIVFFMSAMRATEAFDCFFKALVFCLLWLVRHTVDSSRLSAPSVVTGTRGGSVTVSCQYDFQYRENDKYWCKGIVYELCTIVIRSSSDQPQDRSSIVDDKKSGVFTVTMRSLSESDKDKYWCVISRHGRNVFVGVRLYISDTVTTSIAATQTSPENPVITEQDEMRGFYLQTDRAPLRRRMQGEI